MGNKISAFQDVILRGTDQQVGDELLAAGALWSLPGRATPLNIVGGTTPSVGSTSYLVRGALAITNYVLHNRSGSTIAVGIGFRLRNDQWKAGQWDDDAATPFIDDTVDAQDIGASTGDFALETTTANDGFVIASRHKFHWVSLNVGTAGVGAGTVGAVRYSNNAGTGWTALATNQSFADTFTRSAGVNFAVGEQVFVWAPPIDWGRVTNLSGIPDGYYALNVRATTAPATTAALAVAIEIGTLVVAVEGVVDNATISEEETFEREPFSDALVAFFGTANAGNLVKCEFIHAG